MTEPATSAAAAAGIKLGLSLGAGGLGALAMAAFDPPKTRGGAFAQGLVAGIFAIVGTPIAVRLIDFYMDAIDLVNASVWDGMEVVLPTGFLMGGLSWGVVGAMVKLRKILAERGAQMVADKVGLGVHSDDQ